MISVNEEMHLRTSVRKLFADAADEAYILMQDEPAEKIINQLDWYELTQLADALAQHFVVLLREAATSVDVSGPALSPGGTARARTSELADDETVERIEEQQLAGADPGEPH